MAKAKKNVGSEMVKALEMVVATLKDHEERISKLEKAAKKPAKAKAKAKPKANKPAKKAKEAAEKPAPKVKAKKAAAPKAKPVVVIEKKYQGIAGWRLASAECKKAGLEAKGTTVELLARLASKKASKKNGKKAK